MGSPREEVLRLDRRLHPGFPLHLAGFCQEERKTIYWIKSPPSSSTCQWDYSLFSIQPFFHHLAIWELHHSAGYNIPSSTLIFTFFLQDISLRDFCTFINCLLELS